MPDKSSSLRLLYVQTRDTNAVLADKSNPMRLFSEQDRDINSVSGANVLPASPDNPLSDRVICVTRPSLSVVTPYHVSSGSSLHQFVLSVQFGPSVAL